MNIPYYNLANKGIVTQRLEEQLDYIMRKGKYLGGNIVQQVERKIATRANRKFGIAVGSCSDAIYFSLLAAGVTDEHTVLISSFSHPAALWAVQRIGALPYFLDVNDQFEMIIPSALDPLMYKREIGAMVLTHLFGFAQDPTPAFQLAREYGFEIIEDAAQSFGSYAPAGRETGSTGKYSCLSFDPTKPLGSISTGGMILTDEGESIKPIREMAKIRRSGISNLEANLLNIKMDNYTEATFRRERFDLYYSYNDLLKDIPGVHLPLPPEGMNACSDLNPSKYVIRLEGKQERDYLKEFLRGRGIETRIHYENPLFHYDLERFSYTENYNSRKLAETCLSLPFHGWLDDTDSKYVVKAIKDYFS
jgi:dTDP-4-amino-4,6-dideoxygalactose transaminase